MSVTYYVAIPFVRTEEGDLAAGEAVEVRSTGAAKFRAKLMAINAAGATAFSRSGDPSLGEFQPAVILARYGETPTRSSRARSPPMISPARVTPQPVMRFGLATWTMNATRITTAKGATASRPASWSPPPVS